MLGRECNLTTGLCIQFDKTSVVTVNERTFWEEPQNTLIFVKRIYTARNAQAAARLLSTKPISGCVRIACFGLMITSLLQVVDRLAASCELHAGLMQIVSSTCNKCANIKLQQV